MISSIVDRDGERKNISNQVRAFAKDFNFKIKLCKPRHPFTKGKVEAVNKFLALLLPYEGEFETEDECVNETDKDGFTKLTKAEQLELPFDLPDREKG